VRRVPADPARAWGVQVVDETLPAEEMGRHRDSAVLVGRQGQNAMRCQPGWRCRGVDEDGADLPGPQILVFDVNWLFAVEWG